MTKGREALKWGIARYITVELALFELAEDHIGMYVNKTYSDGSWALEVKVKFAVRTTTLREDRVTMIHRQLDRLHLPDIDGQAAREKLWRAMEGSFADSRIG